MKKLATSSALLALTIGARLAHGAAAEALSELRYEVDVPVSAATLTCEYFRPGPGRYIIGDFATAQLALPEDPYTVFAHKSASLTANLRQPVPAGELCKRTTEVIADAAANGGQLRVKKRVSLSVYKHPAPYVESCLRGLVETVEVELPRGLVFTAQEDRPLSAQPASECGS